jgi:cell division septum initiation protein DivIVA
MALDDSDFTTELRGYKRSEVDDVIRDLRGEIIKASKDRQSALEELKVLQEQLLTLQATGGTDATQTFAGLGGRLETMLRIAEEQSTRLIGQADIDAERMIARAKAEASDILEAASRDAQRLVQDAQNSATTTVANATAEATVMAAEAKADAERVRQEAIDEASAIRGAVATEAAKMRATAKRETEALRSEVKREISELKVVAERELNTARSDAAALAREIEVERASHELTLRKIQEEAALAKTNMEHEVTETTARLAFDNENQAAHLARIAEQARTDLEAELAARRAEAEKDLLEAHQKAVELNNRFLQEAEEQLSETKARLAELRKDHKKIIHAIDEANRSGKSTAEKAASDTLQAAENRAAEIVRSAEEEATSRVAAAERRLVELRAERDTIAGYVESLRSVVSKVVAVEAATSPKKPRESAKRATTAGADTAKGSVAS